MLYRVRVWQEEYGTVIVDIPNGTEPTSNDAKNIIDQYLNDHATDRDEGVEHTESTGWFVDDQVKWDEFETNPEVARLISMNTVFDPKGGE